MRKISLTMFFVMCFAFIVHAGEDSVFSAFCDDVKCDYINFYSGENLLKLGGGLAAGAILANSTADEDIYEWYTNDVKSANTDDMADMVKEFGNGLITVPVYAGAYALSVFGDGNKACDIAGEWGQRSLRAIIVGGPAMLALQVTTGGSRPTDDEHEYDSTWRPFEDGNGVSGHSFMGAVPFISAAKMTKNRAAKSLFYAGSVLCGLSRINDEDHYFSQSLLGWWMAYLAVTSVDKTQAEDQLVSISPILINDCAGVGITWEF
ncbi:phosphatase PAP2 family protein [Verrucomicrobiota bacterium]